MDADAIKQETHVATAVSGVGELASAREAANNAQRPVQENRIGHEDNLVRATEVKARIACLRLCVLAFPCMCIASTQYELCQNRSKSKKLLRLKARSQKLPD